MSELHWQRIEELNKYADKYHSPDRRQIIDEIGKLKAKKVHLDLTKQACAKLQTDILKLKQYIERHSK